MAGTREVELEGERLSGLQLLAQARRLKPPFSALLQSGEGRGTWEGMPTRPGIEAIARRLLFPQAEFLLRFSD